MDLETRIGVIIDCFTCGLDSDYKKTFVKRLMNEFYYEYAKRLNKRDSKESEVKNDSI